VQHETQAILVSTLDSKWQTGTYCFTPTNGRWRW